LVSANLFYVDLFNARACASPAGDPLVFEPVVAGGTLRYSIRFLEKIGNSFIEREPKIAGLRVGIGPVDARPLSGTYRIKIGTGVSQAGVNVTEHLSATSTAVEIGAALNALTGKTSTFLCMDVAGAVVVRRVDGGPEVLTVASNRLVPLSFARFTGVEIDGHWSYELRLTIAPYAFSTSASRVLPDAPSIKTLVDGGTDPSGTFFWNEIQELYVPRTFKGVYQLRYGEYAKTDLLSIDDGPREIEQAINKMLNLPTGRVGSVTVTNPVTDYAHIEFVGDLAGIDVAPLEVVVYSAPEGDWTFELPLDRGEMFFALRDEESIVTPFEAEADFFIGTALVTKKLWQTVLTIRRPQILPDMGTAPNVDWLRLNPRDYIPFTPNQVVTGPQTYSAVIGNGASTIYSIEHGLKTSSLANIIVRRNTAEWDALQEGGDYQARIENDDEVTLTFAEAPAANSLLVYLQAAPAVRQWDAHTHTQEQIEGLKDLLDSMLLRIATLEALLPKAGVAGVTVGPPASYTLPAVGEILPNTTYLDSDSSLASQIVRNDQGRQDVPDGTDVADQQEAEKAAEEEAKKDPESLPPGVVYRVSLPGIGAVARKGQKAEVDEKGNVLVPAVADEPAAPQLWPGRSVSMARGSRWPLLLSAADYEERDLSEGAISSPAFRAVGDVEAVPSALAGSTLAPLVYRNNSLEPLMLPGGSGRRSQVVPPQGLFADDGRCFYRVLKGAGNVYYPAEMERELWRVALTDVQFPNGALLTAGGEIRIQMLGDFFDDEARGVARVDYAGQYFLQCEAVPLEDSSATLGRALEPVVIGRTRVALSPAVESFRWSLSILREAEATTASWFAYGKISDLTAVLPLPAVLRLRLTGFDVDNASQDNIDIFDPRGQIALIAPSSRLQIRL
jgi:hypothetical protein